MSQPIKGSQGYLLVFVSARGDLTFDQAKAELQKAAATQALTDYKAWFDAAAKKADVTRRPAVGFVGPQDGHHRGPGGRHLVEHQHDQGHGPGQLAEPGRLGHHDRLQRPTSDQHPLTGVDRP